MTRRLVLSPKALADLDSIWEYSARTWSAVQADLYLSALDDTFRLLCAHPDIARLRAEFTPPVRLHRNRSHLVIFVVDAGEVNVIRVVHGRSNWGALLEE